MTADAQQMQGDGVWAAEQLAAGRPIRSLKWFRGSIHPAGEELAFFRSEDPQVSPEQQDVPIGSWTAYLDRHLDEVWECADVPRKSTSGKATTIDLALFPSAMPVGMLLQILDRCEANRDELSHVVELVWTTAGQSMIGKALAAFLTNPTLRVSIQLARNGNPQARAAIREAILKLREGR